MERYCISRSGSYTKQPGEDLSSILDGILQPKGRVCLHAGQPFTAEDLAPYAALPHNAFNKKVSELLDERIRSAVQLYPNHYIAADLLSGKASNAAHYTERDVVRFHAYLDAELDRLPASLREAREPIRGLMVDMYAGPLLIKSEL